MSTVVSSSAANIDDQITTDLMFNIGTRVNYQGFSFGLTILLTGFWIQSLMLYDLFIYLCRNGSLFLLCKLYIALINPFFYPNHIQPRKYI